MSPATDELTVEASAPEELRFVAPLLGFDHLSRFALVELDEGSPLFSLRSLEDPSIRLLVMPPQMILDDYTPTIDTVSLAALGLLGGPDPLVLVVVNAGETLATSTVNLLAPILLNRLTGAAAQVVLTGSDYPLRFPLAD